MCGLKFGSWEREEFSGDWVEILGRNLKYWKKKKLWM